jgi:hypothetical protein
LVTRTLLEREHRVRPATGLQTYGGPPNLRQLRLIRSTTANAPDDDFRLCREIHGGLSRLTGAPSFDPLVDVRLHAPVLFLRHHRSNGGLWIRGIADGEGPSCFPGDSLYCVESALRHEKRGPSAAA